MAASHCRPVSSSTEQRRPSYSAQAKDPAEDLSPRGPRPPSRSSVSTQGCSASQHPAAQSREAAVPLPSACRPVSAHRAWLAEGTDRQPGRPRTPPPPITAPEGTRPARGGHTAAHPDRRDPEAGGHGGRCLPFCGAGRRRRGRAGL